jgi:Glycosyltransferase family 9 (heptosyltransferase)
VLAAPRALAPLVALAGTDPRRAPDGVDRAIDELVDVPAWVGGSAARPDPVAAARLPRGTLAVNLHGCGPQSHRLLLATVPSRLIAFAHPDVRESAGGPSWDGHEHEVLRWCRLLREHGIPADPTALDLPPPAGVTRDAEGPTLIHPGATSAARRWPAERWAEVARGERERGRRVLRSGSPAEMPIAAEVAARADLPSGADLSGRTDLRGLVALVAGAGRVVCGDTGLAHLATALRVPSVVLFGPTDPARWGPPADRPWHRLLWAGARGDPHAGTPDAGLLQLQPADVLDALSVLPEPPPRDRLPHGPSAR